MTPTLVDLARRAVDAVPLGDWPNDTPICARASGAWCRCGCLDRGAILWPGRYAPESIESLTAQHGELLPDLSSACGVGALLAVARRRHPGCGLYQQRAYRSGWAVVVELPDSQQIFAIAHGADEVDALLNTLTAPTVEDQIAGVKSLREGATP